MQGVSKEAGCLSPSQSELSRAIALLRYASRHDQVEGWLHHHAADAICDLLDYQTRAGISGGLLEIGVHHGRLFVFLVLSAQPGEPVIGIDVFEDQHLNLDQSGYGSRSAVEANLAKHASGHGSAVTFVKADSTTLTPSKVNAYASNIRAVSIDGCHTAEATEADLRLATAVCQEGGIVFLDDIINAHWLGVMEGYSRYARTANTLVPFCLGENKLFLAKGIDWANRYKNHIMAGRPGGVTKAAVPFFGHEIPILGGGSLPFFDRLLERIGNSLNLENGTSGCESADASLKVSAAMSEATAARNEASSAAARAERAERVVAAMASSSIWRVTSPLRWIANRTWRG
jgi:hypothetical protein